MGQRNVHAKLCTFQICRPNQVNRGYRQGFCTRLPFLESFMGISLLRKVSLHEYVIFEHCRCGGGPLCHSQRISARNQWTKDGALYNSVSQPLLCPVSSYACATTTKTWPLLHARTFSSQMNSSATYCSFLAHAKSSASVQYVHSSSDVAHCF